MNGLTPTIESCTLKLIEELGELLRLIGKGQGLSGEKKIPRERIRAVNMMMESFDVAQSAVTMINTIADKYGFDVGLYAYEHEKKLKEKGYLV